MCEQYAWFEPVTERWAKEATGIPDEQLYRGFKKVSVVFRWRDPVPWLYGIKGRVLGKMKVLTAKALGK